MSFCCWFSVWNLIPSRVGLISTGSWNLFWKKSLTTSFTFWGSSTHPPSLMMPFSKLCLREAFIIRWKYLELQSPSLIHLERAFCLSKDSYEWAATHKSACSCLLTPVSWDESCVSIVISSNLFNSSWISLTFLNVSPNCSLFHTFNLLLRHLIFSEYETPSPGLLSRSPAISHHLLKSFV